MSDSPAPPRTREDAGRRREQILDQVLRIVGERGYHGFGLQELAERCGLTKPGLLHHFGSKDQLLIALLHERDARAEAEVGALLGPEYEAATSREAQREVMRRGLHAIVMRNITQPELMRLQVVLRAESINPDHPAHAYFGAREAAKQALLAQFLTDFVPDPQAVARHLLAIISGLEEQWLRDARGFDLVATCDSAVARLLADTPIA